MSLRTHSHRGYMLADIAGASAVLTVELCTKWYGLHWLHPDGTSTDMPFPDERYAPPGESAYRDHIPNPRAVMNYAKKHNITVGEFAMDLIVGRWHLDTTSEYSE